VPLWPVLGHGDRSWARLWPVLGAAFIGRSRGRPKADNGGRRLGPNSPRAVNLETLEAYSLKPLYA
jgi:hypothetical protein